MNKWDAIRGIGIALAVALAICAIAWGEVEKKRAFYHRCQCPQTMELTE